MFRRFYTPKNAAMLPRVRAKSVTNRQEPAAVSAISTKRVSKLTTNGADTLAL